MFPNREEQDSVLLTEVVCMLQTPQNNEFETKSPFPDTTYLDFRISSPHRWKEAPHQAEKYATCKWQPLTSKVLLLEIKTLN